MAETASTRIRRSVRFAQLENQTGSLRTEAAPRRQRITVADHLETRTFQNTQDWTGGMGISPSGRFRVVEAGRKERIADRKGIRRDWAGRLLALLAAVIAVALLVETAAFGAGQVRIQQLNRSIEAVGVRNDRLREALERSSGDVSVCTEAVKLNLVSSSGVRPIPLTAPSGASMVLMNSETPAETAEMRTSASSDTGNQGD